MGHCDVVRNKLLHLLPQTKMPHTTSFVLEIVHDLHLYRIINHIKHGVIVILATDHKKFVLETTTLLLLSTNLP